MIRKIPTSSMNRDEWLKLRSGTIGGSDASAVLGLNQYKSRYALWAEKTGRVIPEDIHGKESVRLGNDLEDYVAKRFSDATGKRVRRENYTIFRYDMPFAHANYDRLVIGENAGLECKTTNALNMGKFKNGEFPVNYYCQCVHYLMVSGLDRWYLAVLVLGIDFLVFTIERDEEEIQALREAEEAFFHNMQSDTPPEVDGSESTLNALNAQYMHSNEGTVVDLTGYGSDFSIVDMCNSRIKELENKKQAAQARIMEAMGYAERGTCGQYSVTWKTQKRNTFDRKRFEAVNGKIPDTYFKTSEIRPFRFNKER